MIAEMTTKYAWVVYSVTHANHSYNPLGGVTSAGMYTYRLYSIHNVADMALALGSGKAGTTCNAHAQHFVALPLHSRPAAAVRPGSAGLCRTLMLLVPRCTTWTGGDGTFCSSLNLPTIHNMTKYGDQPNHGTHGSGGMDTEKAVSIPTPHHTSRMHMRVSWGLYTR